MLRAAVALPLSQTRSVWRRDVTIAISIRFHNFILVMGMLQDSLLDGRRVVTEISSPALLPQPSSPSCSAAPQSTRTQLCLPIPSSPLAVSEELQSNPWAILYLSQLAGLGD